MHHVHSGDIIEDQQPACSSLQPLPGSFRGNVLIWLVLLRLVQQVCNACEVRGQYLAGSGIYPQHSRVFVTKAIRVFDGYLRLAAAIKTTDYLWLGRGHCFVDYRHVVQVGEDMLAAGEEGIARVRDVPERRACGICCSCQAGKSVRSRLSGSRFDAFNNVEQRLLAVGPGSDRCAVGGQSWEPGKWSILPIDDRAQHDGDDASLASRVLLQGMFHLKTVAILGMYKIGTHEQQNDLSCVQVGVDFSRPFASQANATLMPVADDALPTQITQVCCQFVSPWLIFVGIGEEDVHRHRVVPFSSDRLRTSKKGSE